MKPDRQTVSTTFARCVRLRCPACGGAAIVAKPFQIRESCPACRVLFKREEGFFVGAILANVITTELVILLVYLLCLPIFTLHSQAVLTVLFVVGISFPIAFYHHSWSFWLGVDHLIESLPKS